MSEIDTTISDIKLFIERLKSDLPEIFEGGKVEETRGKTLYCGDLLDTEISAGAEENKVLLEDNILKIYMKSPDEDPSLLADQWLKERSKEIIPAAVKEWAAKMGVEYNNLVIKDQKTVWGSCSDKKNLNFTYRLVKLPKVVMDYLIVHELAHLVHMNHGEDYWKLVESLSPDYNKHRKWLNSNKSSVMSNSSLRYISPEEQALAQQAQPQCESAEPAAEGPGAQDEHSEIQETE